MRQFPYTRVQEIEVEMNRLRDELGKLRTQYSNTQECLNQLYLRRKALIEEETREITGQTLFDDMFDYDGGDYE